MGVIFECSDIIRDYCDNYRNSIVQQNNCTVVKVNTYSFVGKLVKKYPYSNPYSERNSGIFFNMARINDRPVLGSICLKYVCGTNKHVVCYCFAQYRMGDGLIPFIYIVKKKNINYKETPDNGKIRFENFKTCLDKLLREFRNNNHTRLNMINTIVLPGYIECNHSGGVWSLYKEKIY